MAYISILTAICLSSITFSDAAVSVDASFNDARCDGGMVCPNDRLLFTCTVTGSDNLLAIVTIASGEVQIRSDNTVLVGEGGLPDGVTVYDHSAVVNNGVADYVLILMIDAASQLNDGMINCSDASLTPLTDEAACPVATDPPGPPQSLTQDESANTVSSLVVEWQSPSLTGGTGISITSYTITVDDGLSGTVSDDGSEVYTHNITGLVYNTDYSVEVTAVNECGLTSQLATLTANIEARGPPIPTTPYPELICSNRSMLPVVIHWENGERVTNIIYPSIDVSVVLIPGEFSPGEFSCVDVSEDDESCALNVTSDMEYTISINLMNKIGFTVAQSSMFDATVFYEESRLDKDPPHVLVTVNEICSNSSDYNVSVSFGVRDQDTTGCVPVDVVSMVLDPGEARNFTVNTSDPQLMLKENQQYCYQVSLQGVPPEPTTSPTASQGLSSEEIISIGVSVPLAIIIMALIAAAVALYLWKKKKHSTNNGHELKALRPSSDGSSPEPKDPSSAETGEAGPTYQDPNTISRSPHPSTGEVYTDVNLDKKKAPIEHEMAPGGEMYAMPLKTAKKGKKKKGGEEEELTVEEKAALYSVPDKKGQKAKSKGLNYADIDLQSSAKPAPPSQGSQYVEVKHN